jgi:hypothetical protein
MLDAHSIRIMELTSECRINERVWKRHNAYGRRSISRICWLPIVLQQKWSMYLLTWTGELSTYLWSFFHSSACTLCSHSLLFYYIRPSSIVNSPRFHAYYYLPSFCLSRASPGLHFFPSLLFSGSFVQCAQLFLQFLTFPIPGRSIIIALNRDVQFIKFKWNLIYVGGARVIITSLDTCTSFKTQDLYFIYFCGLLKERFVSVVAVYVRLLF